MILTLARNRLQNDSSHIFKFTTVLRFLFLILDIQAFIRLHLKSSAYISCYFLCLVRTLKVLLLS